MTPALGLLVRWGEIAIAQVLLVRFVRAVKYRDAPHNIPATPGDLGIALLLGGAMTGLAALHAVGGLVAFGAGAFLFVVLWLDAALYRVFTFELGAGGVAGVVLSNLIREVVKMRAARRFFRYNLAFALLPLAAFAAHLLVLVPDSLPRTIVVAALVCYLAWTLLSEPPRLSARTAELSVSIRPRALVHDFLRPRRPRIPDGFQPRPEHAPALALGPALPRPSPQHRSLHRQGQSRGPSVVLLTFESVGSAHLETGAHTPFFNGLAASSTVVRSQNHFCLAPLTNTAHVALYFSDYGPLNGQDTPALVSLRKAGYETIYLTAANVGHYGLADILRRAGFRHIVDGTSLTPHPLDGGTGAVSDHALLSDGIKRVAALIRGSGRPFFLHVHAANSHIPYRITDGARFHRHDSHDDRGRFLNAVEETDWIFGELWAALRALAGSEGGGEDEPLLVVSSDHGQAFGEQGYWSHGSAVIHEEINVPLLLHHPRLARRAVRFSTHFDVLPTVLDLLGVPASQPGYGTSLFNEGPAGPHLLWDGMPSRSTSSCLGLLLGEQKYTLDLVRETCIVSDWDDGNARLLTGEERSYFEALIGLVARKRGIS